MSCKRASVPVWSFSNPSDKGKARSPGQGSLFGMQECLLHKLHQICMPRTWGWRRRAYLPSFGCKELSTGFEWLIDFTIFWKRWNKICSRLTEQKQVHCNSFMSRHDINCSPFHHKRYTPGREMWYRKASFYSQIYWSCIILASACSHFAFKCRANKFCANKCEFSQTGLAQRVLSAEVGMSLCLLSLVHPVQT